MLVAAVTLLSTAKFVEVTTNAGRVRGEVIDGVSTFRGIPYAEPPTGNNRWRPPTARAAWNGTFDAGRDAPGCPQKCALPPIACPPVQSEDCLALNVFTPEKLSNTEKKKAVMFFIHGGNFYQGYGGGALYDGSSFAKHHDVVVVSINYRLGALGFLYSGDDAEEDFTGNFGLLDQRLALEWARDNIGAFGGDASRVTVFGQSAGAMSIASHLIMPKSKGLFARAIVQSDPFGLPFRTAKTYPSFTRTVAHYAGCEKLLKRYEPCMRSVDTQTLVEAQVRAQKDLLVELGHFLNLFVPYSPVVGGGSELAEQPLAAAVYGRLHDVPMMVGSVRDECLIFVYEAFGTPMSGLVEDAVLDMVFGAKNTTKILKQYPRPKEARREVETDSGRVAVGLEEWREVSSPAEPQPLQRVEHRDLRRHAANLTTDALFHCPIRHAAYKLAQQQRGVRSSPTFVYHFDHVASFGANLWKPSGNYSGDTECIDAVCHSAELPFVFGDDPSSINATFTKDEAHFITSLQKYWTAFAKNAQPSGDVGERRQVEVLAPAGEVEWPAFGTEDQRTMLFQTPNNRVEHASYLNKCAFWDGIGYEWVLKP
jgi:carboxylesterase type B